MKIILTHIQGSLAGRKTEFEGPFLRVGRDPKDCDLIFDSSNEPGVSRLHAEITYSDGLFYLEDLKSRNGTFLDAKPVKGKIELYQGGVIQFGVEGPIVRFEYEAPRKSKSPRTQPVPTYEPNPEPNPEPVEVLVEKSEELPAAKCLSCGAEFAMALKFCRQCGKPITSSLRETPVSLTPVEDLKESESRLSAPFDSEPAPLESEDSTEPQRCYSCGRKIAGDPKFCPGCGAKLESDSSSLFLERLKESLPPPAATAYVAFGKADSSASAASKPERAPKSKRNIKSLMGKERKPVPQVPEDMPAVSKLSSIESEIAGGSEPSSAQTHQESAAKSKSGAQRIMRPGPLIPPLKSDLKQHSNSRENAPSPSKASASKGLTDRLKPISLNVSSPAQSLLISAQALGRKGHIAQAIEECERALRLDPQLPEIHNLLGQLLLENGDGEKAIAAFMKALKIRPVMAEAYANLGRAYLRTGRFEDAAVSAREAIKIDKVIPEAYHTIGQALMEMGDFDRAFEAFSRALRVKPNYPEAYLGMATIQFRCGRAEECVNSCRQAIKARSDYHQAFCLKGQAYRAKGQYKDAGRAFHDAIRIKPDYAIAYNYLALNYRSQALVDEAENACRKALEIEPDLPEARNTMGLLCCDRGQFSEGLAEYRRAIEIRPNYAEAHNNLGLCCFKMRQIDSAIECFEKSIELEPQFALARFNLALCFFKKRDKYGAKKQYEILCGLDKARSEKLYQKIKSLIS